MANVYVQDTQRLHDLLHRASTNDGTTLLIPDLQRPYVWTPNQVTLLIDSLIRGWPFGTLLLWKVRHEELKWIPFRPFWKTVDRVEENGGDQAAQMNPPAEYHMVLDGQQRVQSLLLALGGDDWGFKLDDRDWTEELKERRARGRLKYKHWSKASLCFDLDTFLTEYTAGNKSILAVDFRSVLVWAVTDPVNGQSNYPKPENYEEPLVKAHLACNQRRYVRLSRLWNQAQPNPNLKETHFQNLLRPVLEVQGVLKDTIEALMQPMGELMTTLRDVKMSEVAYLELQPFDENVWTQDTYNDAIVSIFTRLNTAGRTLTREEITLAWLKVGWERAKTGDRSADQCFTKLLRDLKESKLDIEMDKLVGAVSFIWSICDNGGKLLEDRDLLKGDVIKPMASALSGRWDIICRAAQQCTEAVNERALEYGPGGHYASLNALAIAWTWLYLGLSWETVQKLTEPQRDDFRKKCLGTLASHLDRWLMCSQWAGRWSGSSNTAVAAYAKALNEDYLAIAKVSDLDAAHAILANRLATWVKDLEGDAAAYVNAVNTASRERVVVYRNVLWTWHRLDADRWRMSQIPLRAGKSKKTSPDVDHTVAFSFWDKKLTVALPTGFAERDEAVSLINRLGNCSLLEKSFNISKSDKTLKSFMEQVHEFKTGAIALGDWAKAMAIPDVMLDATAATTNFVLEAINTRDATIRANVVEFVKGQKVRVDL